jgi:putative transcriptional regulator
MNRIKTILQEQGRTQIWLAQKIGKSYGVVTNYCNNHKQPNLVVLAHIAQLLEVDIRELLVSSFPKKKSSPGVKHGEKPLRLTRKTDSGK